jgi:hypothetical protein
MPVLVELFEGVPDQLSWDFSVGLPEENFRAPAMGFAHLPSRYTETGVKADRRMPFLFRATVQVSLPPGRHSLLLRAHGGARLSVDGQPIISTRFPNLTADGHEDVPEIPSAAAPDIRPLPPGHFETVAPFQADGAPHVFVLETLVGLKGRRPEVGELAVAVAVTPVESVGDKSHRDPEFRLLAPGLSIPLTDAGWTPHAAAQAAWVIERDREARRAAAKGETRYWAWRHALARTNPPAWQNPLPAGAESVSAAERIDWFIDRGLVQAGVAAGPLTDDHTFLRRVSLDVTGRPPTPDQVAAFLAEAPAVRRARVIDRLLEDPGWAENWVGYWQDVLAENPGILKPMLNNTGPFRWWLRESLADNKPMDQFASELILMEGSAYYGGPAGFGMATDNDVPMAQKAQIVAQAFLGMQLQCARCHDAPYHNFKQKDLFSLAAMLRRAPQEVPASSSIPTNANIVLGRLVNVTLAPGSRVAPAWPFPAVQAAELPDGMLRHPEDSRERLAALVTGVHNTRFARVIVNRLWRRYLGWGLVEPVDDWENARPSHPELLDWLAVELATHDYDLKHVARLILKARVYQRAIRSDGSEDRPPEKRLFAAPARRRLTAEQVLDSLFAVVGKRIAVEELNMDVDGRRPVKDFNNLGLPHHAWEFTSLSNERDRPALSMPRAQQAVDVLTAFGWRESRQNPQSMRDHSPNVLQPATLANGAITHGHIARLSEDSAVTALALEDRSLPELVTAVFLRLLSRPPTTNERRATEMILADGFAERRLPPSGSQPRKSSAPTRAVSWANHLNPEATRIKQTLEREARAGDPPTERLRAAWRERMEDVVWALINSPEFIFVP